MKILVADKFPQTGIDSLQTLGCQVVSAPDLKDDSLEETLAAEAPDVLVVRSTGVNEAHLDASKQLGLVIRAGAGFNTIDVAGASARGIYVANCPGKNAVAVAELAFAHLLSVDRRLVDGALQLREGRWNKKELSRARGVKGTTLGLVGLGNIGREMIDRATAFGMSVVAWSRSLRADQAESLGVEPAGSPEEVAARCDVLSIHLALNDDTRARIGESVLAALPYGALLINTARAEIIDQPALERQLRAGRLRAAVDVFDGEPAAGAGKVDPALFRLPGVQGSHHIGASTAQAQCAVADEVVRIVRTLREQGKVPNCVNLAGTGAASHLLTVRHRDRVGVLAGVLDRLRAADINVQQMENVVFSGAPAAVARIELDRGPAPETLRQIGDADHILALHLTALAP